MRVKSASFVVSNAKVNDCPKSSLPEFAGVDKAVVLSAAVNIIEIWDKDCYEKAIDEAAVDFAALAEEVMGDDQDNVS